MELTAVHLYFGFGQQAEQIQGHLDTILPIRLDTFYLYLNCPNYFQMCIWTYNSDFLYICICCVFFLVTYLTILFVCVHVCLLHKFVKQKLLCPCGFCACLNYQSRKSAVNNTTRLGEVYCTSGARPIVLSFRNLTLLNYVYAIYCTGAQVLLMCCMQAQIKTEKIITYSPCVAPQHPLITTLSYFQHHTDISCLLKGK